MKKKPSDKSGFTLVVTLVMMVLLAVIVVGMLSLSSISLRASSRSDSQAEAQANARLALMLAIGELQKYTGSDTRITAPSGIVDNTAPPLTGVWRSWEGTDHVDTNGMPKAPDYEVKSKEITAKTSKNNDGRFLTWLVSGALAGKGPSFTGNKPSDLVSSSISASTVPLLAGGTLGSNPGQVHVKPQLVQNNTGAIAWWVSGENQKARLPQPYKPNAVGSAAAWSDLAKSHAVADPSPFGLDGLLNNPDQATKAITANTANLLPAAKTATTKPSEFFHDLSVSSVGLLTNSATGGWRKDMSLITENWENLPDSDLPLFRLSPGRGFTTQVTRPTGGASGDALATQSIIYPWCDYGSGFPWEPPISTQYTSRASGPAASWENLVHYATLYRTKITPSADGTGVIPYSWTLLDNSNNAPAIDNTHRYAYLHTIRTSPSLARFHWVFSHRTKEITPSTNPKTYRLELLITPVVTLWNPYNVAVSAPPGGLLLRLAKPPPCALIYHDREGGAMLPGRKIHQGSNTGNAPEFVPNYPDSLFGGTASLECRIPDLSPALLPGETRVYSASTTATGTSINMQRGYNPKGGFRVNIGFLGPAHRSEDLVRMNVKFDNLMNFQDTGQSGIFLDLLGTDSADRVYQRYLMKVPVATAQTYWPEIAWEDLPHPPAGEIEDTLNEDKWKPFFSMVFGSRTTSNSSFPTKGLAQTSPLVSITQSFAGIKGSTHPANNAFDFSFFPHALGGDDKTPNANNANHRGYIISGFQAGDGLSRVILNELPLRPMASLAELQNWDLRSHNPYPPFQLNIIGNSDAPPLIKRDAAYHSNSYDILQHDDSYCANHLLFDDWFFSSIAPEPANFGSTVSSDLRAVYRDFLEGERFLVNRNYRLIAGDQGLDDGRITERIDSALGPDGWQRIASRLEVEGMFNVNSTSVKAWRALLGHARDQRIPHYTEGGIALSEKTDHAFSRAPVAGDNRAGGAGMSGAFPESTELTGYRVFDDTLLDSLAKKIVEQVRRRGPFLSLSEFVNRQLSEDEDLAVAGAIQVALDEMSEATPDDDPHKILKDLSQPTQADPPGAEGYQFRAAAEGYSNYGLPGWIRQADVLRPLAPILSARDDTFTIRAYGDSRDSLGNVVARAWCEATVRRTRDFVDPADAADTTDAPEQPVNQTFGRRYMITSFRWLRPNEV